LFSLEDCYSKGLLRKTAPSPLKAHRSLEMARTWLREAGTILRAGAPRSAMVAIYMSYFHAARALLFRDGVREKSHGCIGLYLESYREKGLLEEEWLLQFERIRSLRHEDQYMLGADPSVAEIEEFFRTAPEFITAMEELLGTPA